ncbi:hypothetical protein [Streptomyces erythrochromogenes]|uniref:hypothetical protein n=1 Tax=Streptomyces erythrochromogenes TaxID=285574 RepID=UPI0036942D32
MTDRRTTTSTDGQGNGSLSGHSWPIVPLLVAFLLLRGFPDATWAYVCAAAIGGLGALAALYGISECVKAARGNQALRVSAAWVVLVLLLGMINWIRMLF